MRPRKAREFRHEADWNRLEGAVTGRCLVIPSYDRPDKVRACLRAVAALNGGPPRTIVVDDGSPAPLAEVCAEFGFVTCIRQENAGPGAARNAGARAAEGADLLLFTDDDCTPRPDWADRLAAVQAGTERVIVGGRVDNALPDNVFSSASQSLCGYLYEWYRERGSDMTFFTTNNMCCRRTDFLDIGGFDAGFSTASEDRDFSMRWKDAGGRLAYAEDAVVDHAHDMGLGQFWRQHAGYGRGARHLHLTMDGRGDERPKVEPFRFYAGMLAHPLRNPGRNRLAQSALVGLSQVAMVAGYAQAIRDARRQPVEDRT